MTLSVEGLGATYDLKSNKISFTLRGLGLDFQRGDLQIGGGFLNVNGDFAGKVIIKAKTFSIAALGAVSGVDGHRSIFIYGVLNYPLGGPAFFFVEGLAAGFGYNRSFRMPAIDGVRQFPLVQDAESEPAAIVKSSDQSDKAAVEQQLLRLADFIAPAAGEYFFAAGIKFSTFKLVHSFLLLAIVAGKRFEIDLLGISTYENPPVVPPDLPPLAHIELNLTGRIVPDEGVAIVQGQLTDNSFVYSQLVKLSGGFAFATWFAEPANGDSAGPHAGDFVLTVGGYHPQFNKPAWYPDVPRIGITYQVKPTIYVKGTGYFALTPSVLMAGAALEAYASVDPVEATFNASIDFLICWEPYHYEAGLSVSIAASLGTIHFEASADLEIWGPPFSGVAHVHTTVGSFTVEFGDKVKAGPVPISWSGNDGFRRKFLLSAEDDREDLAHNKKRRKISTMRPVDGVLSTFTKDGIEVAIVNPTTFQLETSCPIPFTTGTVNAQTVNQPASTFGVAPMAIKSTTATHSVTFLLNGQPLLTSQYVAVPISKQFPPGMWGTQFRVTDPANTPPLVDGFGGIRISPPISDDSGTEIAALRNDLDFARPTPNPLAAFSGTPVSYSISSAATGQVRASLAAQAAKRTDMLSALGFTPSTDVRLSDSLESAFISLPKVVQA